MKLFKGFKTKNPITSIGSGFANVIQKPSLGSIADMGTRLATGGQVNLGDVIKKKKDSAAPGVNDTEIQQKLKERLAGGGEVGAQMQQAGAAQTANIQRQQAAQGLKGGGTARMLADVQRNQQAQVAASLYGMQGKALGDYTSYIYGKQALNEPPPKQRNFFEDMLS